MTKKQIKKWKRAANLARVAMGKKKVMGATLEVASEDPLAWWCLTEAIYYFK